MILEFGQIRNVDYGNGEDLYWPINSNCETVHILSTLFKTETYWDKAIIDRIQYSGNTNINQIVSTNFTVGFLSDGSITDEGFILNWSCTQWGEWTQSEAGICFQEKRPIINGRNTTGILKYNYKNSTCGKFTRDSD